MGAVLALVLQLGKMFLQLVLLIILFSIQRGKAAETNDGESVHKNMIEAK